MRNTLHPTLLAVFMAALSLSASPLLHASKSDVGKEQRWAEQVVDALLDGEEFWLDDGAGHEFLALYTESETPSQRAAIVVHGIGVHPDWPDVIYPLRTGLIEHGWHTLSIQMPVLPNEAEGSAYLPLFSELAGRFESAIAFLEERDNTDIAIVAHSMGSTMSASYLAGTQRSVSRFVAVGMGPGIGPDIDNANALSNIALPTLDLYGSDDLEGVVASAGKRADALKAAGADGSRQQVVDGANHFFQGFEEPLVDAVATWLNATAE